MVLNVCKLANQRDAALCLFKVLLQNNHTFQPDIKSYNKLLNLCAKLKLPLLETAMEIINSMEKDKHFRSRELDIHCVTLAISVCVHKGKLDLIQDLLNHVGINVANDDELDLTETKYGCIHAVLILNVKEPFF